VRRHNLAGEFKTAPTKRLPAGSQVAPLGKLGEMPRIKEASMGREPGQCSLSPNILVGGDNDQECWY
jgi:hypothetical protein